MSGTRIVFVYNADEGFFNARTDTAHKIFSPATYQCNLCRFTYGLTGMLMPWKRYLDSLPFPFVFFHRTDFRRAYPGFEPALPVVFAEAGGQRRILLGADDIAASNGLEGLIARMQEEVVRLRSNVSA